MEIRMIFERTLVSSLYTPYSIYFGMALYGPEPFEVQSVLRALRPRTQVPSARHGPVTVTPSAALRKGRGTPGVASSLQLNLNRTYVLVHVYIYICTYELHTRSINLCILCCLYYNIYIYIYTLRVHIRIYIHVHMCIWVSCNLFFVFCGIAAQSKHLIEEDSQNQDSHCGMISGRCANENTAG